MRTIIRLVKQRGELNVVVDQIGCPTWSRLIAEATPQLLAQPQLTDVFASGATYHLVANGSTSWHGFGEAIAAHMDRSEVRDKLTYAGSMSSIDELNGNDRHVFVRGDIGDRPLVQSLLQKHRPWAIVNFAAESHADCSIDAPGEFIQTNVVGVYALLEEARQYWGELDKSGRAKFRFPHVSTDEVYGSLEERDPAFTECSLYQPNSPYAASKAASDHLVRAYHHTYGLPTLTTNCSNNYGPYQFPEKLIPLMILTALDGRPLPIYGDGRNVRDWLYVDDHCDAIRTVLFSGRVRETYNIGGECERSNLQIVEALCAVLDDLVPSPDGEAYSSLISFLPV